MRRLRPFRWVILVRRDTISQRAQLSNVRQDARATVIVVGPACSTPHGARCERGIGVERHLQQHDLGMGLAIALC